MKNYKGTWCVYPWYYEDGEDLIHPADINRYKERFLYHGDCMMFCIDETEEYISLKYKDEIFRVKPKLYKRVKMPMFSYGDFLKIKKYPESSCIVEDLRWHYKREEPIYSLLVDGKVKSKRYYEDEFILE